MGCQGILPQCTWHNFPPSSGMTWLFPELFLASFSLIPCCSRGIFVLSETLSLRCSLGWLWDSAVPCYGLVVADWRDLLLAWGSSCLSCSTLVSGQGHPEQRYSYSSRTSAYVVFCDSSKKCSSEKGVCHFSHGHGWQTGSD